MCSSAAATDCKDEHGEDQLDDMEDDRKSAADVFQGWSWLSLVGGIV